ncbi:MAG: hypothetical protein DHS20C16_08980 [Phycisphaerae bacterium]|nr:MAG: hypothetical protein DHS20C16_08980 [Phycisphaerae bacterium]
MLSSGMLIGGVWFALSLSAKTLAGATGHLGARVAQVISFVAMALVILPYLIPSVFGQ